MARVRLRLSLLTAILLMTIVGLAIAVALQWREVGPLRAENKRLDEERGTLVIGDPNQLNAIRIPARFAGEGRQSFRVYVPPGRLYHAFVQVNNIPKDGLPERTTLPDQAGILGLFRGRLFARIGPGEHTVTIWTVHRGGRADIMLIVGFDSSKIALDVSANTPRNRWPTVTPETYSVFGDGVGGTTIAAEGTEPFVLMRHRIQAVTAESINVGWTTPEPDFPLDGVMLWVETAP